MVKPLCVTLGIGGFLLSSTLVAQAHTLLGGGKSLCTLCLVSKDVANDVKHLSTKACSPTPATDQSPWVDFQGLFHQGGGPVDIHGTQCSGEVTSVDNAQGAFIALCCIQNQLPAPQ
jgi:hypothetical protein